jgi:uncharacterized protein with PQ loop repeat
MIELEQFGWNLVTLTFGIIVLTTAVGVWGMAKQARTIWSRRSGRSVSVIMFSYAAAYMTAGVIYGFQIGSLALVCDLPWALLTVVVLVGLWRYKGFRWYEYLLVMLFGGAAVAMSILPYKELFYLAFCVGNVVALVTQPWEMVREGTRGSVDRRFLWALLLTCLVWVTYGFAIGDLIVPLSNVAYGIVVIVTIILWDRLPADKQSTDETVGDGTN